MRTAPSQAARDRDTSYEKSTWPGVGAVHPPARPSAGEGGAGGDARARLQDDFGAGARARPDPDVGADDAAVGRGAGAARDTLPEHGALHERASADPAAVAHNG